MMSKSKTLSSGDAAASGPTLQHPAVFVKYRDFARTILLIVFWYTVNIALIISNKWLISETGYHSTSMLTLLHMMTSFLASSMLLGLGFVPGKQVSYPLLCKVAVLATSFTVSVATCMASLAYLPASFVQALGSTTPLFTAVLAYLIQGRREADFTYGALVPVMVGIALASGGEPLFNMTGLVLQLVACSTRSFKTVLQAVLLTDERDRFHPMTLLAYTSSMATALLVILTIVTEPHALREAAALHATNPSFMPLMVLSCSLAFLANFTNFLISKQLGALTLQVLGNFKNVLAAITAVAVFSNPVTAMGAIGYSITTAGVFVYSHLVHKNPARWLTPPVSRLLGSAFTYRPATDPEAALAESLAAYKGKGSPMINLSVGAGVPVGTAGGTDGSGRVRGRDVGREREEEDGPGGLGERAPLLTPVDKV